MDEQTPLTGTSVEQIHEPDLPRGTVIAASTPLSEVVETLDFKPDLQALYVVDPRDRYVGVITREDVAGWIDHNVDARGLEGPDAARLSDALGRASAQDAVHPRSADLPVEPSEPIEHALRRMVQAGIPVAPVVEPDGSIVGEIPLTRVLRRVSK